MATSTNQRDFYVSNSPPSSMGKHFLPGILFFPSRRREDGPASSTTKTSPIKLLLFLQFHLFSFHTPVLILHFIIQFLLENSIYNSVLKWHHSTKPACMCRDLETVANKFQTRRPEELLTIKIIRNILKSFCDNFGTIRPTTNTGIVNTLVESGDLLPIYKNNAI